MVIQMESIVVVRQTVEKEKMDPEKMLSMEVVKIILDRPKETKNQKKAEKKVTVFLECGNSNQTSLYLSQ